MTRGMDFRKNTSSADAKPPSQEGMIDVFSGASDVLSGVFSAVVDFCADYSVETDDADVSKLTCPKDPSRISSREEVSVPARAILILPKPF